YPVFAFEAGYRWDFNYLRSSRREIRMAQFFSRSANNIARISMVMVVVLGGVVFYVYTQVARSSYLTGQYLEKQQPVQFSHKHHVGDDGIDCRYCHTSVETSAYAGIPPTTTCMNCHKQIWADSPYLEPVRESWRTGKPIKWTRVHDLPDFAYFNHSIHINKGVGCTTCHGQVDRMPLMWQEQSLQMEWCIDCHRHPEQYVRPRSAVFRTDYVPPSDQQAL